MKRVIGLDCVRAIAISFVILGHFMLHTHLSRTPLVGLGMYLQLFLLPIFNTGVPLFLLLTGYLNTEKEYSFSYLVRIKKVLIPYLFFSVLTIFYRGGYLREDYSIIEWILKIFDFSAIPSGWYIEMYIGLYILIPFLNILYNNIKTKEHKIALISVLIILTLLPKLFNKGDFKLLPEWWLGLYPICYYYIGAYVKEYQIVVKRIVGLLVIIGLALLEPITNYLFYDGSLISIARTVQSPLCAITAVLIFLMLYKKNIKSIIISNTIQNISKLSLEMYLVSYIFDSLLYPIFMDRFFITDSQFTLFFPIITLSVFILSYIVSFVYHLVFIPISK